MLVIVTDKKLDISRLDFHDYGVTKSSSIHWVSFCMKASMPPYPYKTKRLVDVSVGPRRSRNLSTVGTAQSRSRAAFETGLIYRRSVREP